MKRNSAISKMNTFGANSVPFVFVIDYSMNECVVEKVAEAAKKGIIFNFNGKNNFVFHPKDELAIDLKPNEIGFEKYLEAFNVVQEHLHRGNSYLVNLTFETPVETSATLEEIFHHSKAPYKLLFGNRFVVFSPESFIKTEGNSIFTFPMKGTIDADFPGAMNVLMNNGKELAEHATIVDLLRNDLSKHAHQVQVEKFRYIDTIHARNKHLLQVSSRVRGELDPGFRQHLGNIIFDMLPAGSVTGAPKQKTLEIIARAESHQRGFYTGVAGVFDGQNIDSCVLIRFIEQKNNGKMVYKSGGGITTQSIAIDEYNEINNKIYVPVG